MGGDGGGIFAAGTIQWSWGLAPNEGGGDPDPRLQRLTTNLIRGLSQRLVQAVDDTVVIRAALTGPSITPQMPLAVELRHAEPDTISYGTFTLLDDGVWPDSLADDSVYTVLVPLPAGARMPIELIYDLPGYELHTSANRNWLWPSDSIREGAYAWRFVDSLEVVPQVDAVETPTAFAPRLATIPNPFRGGLHLSWDAGFSARRLTIHDARGRRVADLALSPGANGAAWDGRDLAGRTAPAGIYWARAQGPAGVRIARVVKLP